MMLYKNMMIEWELFSKTLFLKRIQELATNLWVAGIYFFDDHGNCQISRGFSSNSICKAFDSCGGFEGHCLKIHQEHVKIISKTHKPALYKCSAGLRGVAVPIMFDRQYAGAMVGCGVYSDQEIDAGKIQYIISLKDAGVDETRVDQFYRDFDVARRLCSDNFKKFMDLGVEYIKSVYLSRDKVNLVLPKVDKINKQTKSRFKGIVSVSKAMDDIFFLLEGVKDSKSPMLIEGETGTGKELLAAYVHYKSPCKEKIFMVQSCFEMTEDILRDLLFGYKKDEFDSGINDKVGLPDIAEGGTLVFDEIGDMDLEVQGLLLRVLDDGGYNLEGGIEQKRTNVRVIATTNKNLTKLAEDGLFRKDLLFRINDLHIKIPPIRMRKDDILPIADYFLDTFAEMFCIAKKGLNPMVSEYMVKYDWPGNVRELKSFVKHLIKVAWNDKVIDRCHIPDNYLQNDVRESDEKNEVFDGANLRDSLKVYEKSFIQRELQKANWNKTNTAKVLGLSRATLNTKIELLKIKRV